MNTPPIPTATTPDPWEEHLSQQLILSDRAYTFDMDDGPEQVPLAQCVVLNDAIQFLNREVGEVYRDADQQAIAFQGTHRFLAKWAIWTGALAVMLAIAQPALTRTLPEWAGKAAWLEGAAVMAGVFAVVFGLLAKFGNKWFVRRHVAERLRMLKFLALGQSELWCGKKAEWEAWVRGQIETILKIKSIEQVKHWAESVKAEPDEPKPPQCAVDPAEVCAYSTYYQWKRVKFQAAYFNNQTQKYRNKSWFLVRVPLPLFFLSIGAVGLHFFADLMGGAKVAGGTESIGWHEVGVWALTAAALLPVASLCVRAWLGAFEHVRSASLFAAKRQALISLSDQLTQDRGDLATTMHHIAHVEHFLENEHGEWLRLLLEAEWFL